MVLQYHCRVGGFTRESCLDDANNKDAQKQHEP